MFYLQVLTIIPTQSPLLLLPHGCRFPIVVRDHVIRRYCDYVVICSTLGLFHYVGLAPTRVGSAWVPGLRWSRVHLEVGCGIRALGADPRAGPAPRSTRGAIVSGPASRERSSHPLELPQKRPDARQSHDDHADKTFASGPQPWLQRVVGAVKHKVHSQKSANDDEDAGAEQEREGDFAADVDIQAPKHGHGNDHDDQVGPVGNVGIHVSSSVIV